MQNTRKKSSGWASFDRNPHQEALVESQFVDDPYPPISIVNSKDGDVASNKFQGKKSYSSVTQSSMNFTPLPSDCQGSRNKSSENCLEPNTISSLEYLKKNHDWASKDVIQDILIATNDDKDQVSVILESMAPVDPQKETTSKCQGSRNKSSENYLIPNIISSLECLKKIHNWASEDVIHDILIASNNDKDQVSSILESMAPVDPQKETTSKCQGSRNKNSENYLEPNAISSLDYLKKNHDWASKDVIQDILIATNDDRDEVSVILENMAPVDPQKETTSKCQGSRNKNSENYLEPNAISSLDYLKKNHDWASKDVIQDILIATNDDRDEVSVILESMAPVDPQKETTSKCQGSRNKSSENYLIPNTISSLECLKKIHNWASEDVIQDILIASNNDKDQVSAMLESMAPVDPQKKTTDLSSMSSYLCDNQEKNLFRENDGDSGLEEERRNEKHIVKNPIFTELTKEPEYKGNDDPYAIYRKDAIKMTKIASHHSQLANNFFLKGDHSSARLYSSKAQAEWKIVEKLNAKAAKEILSIQNINNDPWRLDLHGLHAREAISVLKERLMKIEYQERSKHVFDKKTEVAKLQAVPQLKQNKLHVITGIGKHSQKGATLPSTIKSFLVENRYRFDDTRPGLYVIHPKFRR